MIKQQCVLLALLTCLISITVLAEASVEIEISGINKRLEDNVRLFLSIEQQKNHALITEGRLRRLHQKAPQEIAKALQPFGYYRPSVESVLEISESGNWLARYTIDSGKAIPIGSLKFEISEAMRNDPAFEELLRDIPFKVGQIFSHLEYENFKASLVRLASERGYFDARFDRHRIEIDLDTYEARIDLSYQGGGRYRFGEIQLDQNILDANLLARYIPFEAGSYYTMSDMIELQQALNDSDYFRTVEVSPGKPIADSEEIPVSILLTPNKRNRYSLGLGYGTDTGARAKFGWQIPRVNPQGHRFNLETKFSEIGYSVIANYRVPVLNPRTDQIVYSAGEVNEKTDTSDSTVRSLGASLKRSRNEWRESVSINYQQEDFEVAGNKDSSTLLLPGINYSRIWGKEFIFATDGLRFDIGLRGASKQLFSDAEFLQLQGGVKVISSLNPKNRIIGRASLGSISTSEFEELPSSIRFFTGGGQSVRGYAYQSLGPVGDTGLVEGGKHLMVGSIEFEHRLNQKWGLAAFIDAGNAINDFSDDLEQGAGVGIRWNSPVGQVRIDIARALTLEGKPWRLHLNIGPDL